MKSDEPQMSTYRKTLLASLLFLGLYHLIGECWCAIEVYYYGKTIPNDADTIIGLAFAASLYKNLGITIQ